MRQRVSNFNQARMDASEFPRFGLRLTSLNASGRDASEMAASVPLIIPDTYIIA